MSIIKVLRFPITCNYKCRLALCRTFGLQDDVRPGIRLEGTLLVRSGCLGGERHLLPNVATRGLGTILSALLRRRWSRRGASAALHACSSAQVSSARRREVGRTQHSELESALEGGQQCAIGSRLVIGGRATLDHPCSLLARSRLLQRGEHLNAQLRL